MIESDNHESHCLVHLSQCSFNSPIPFLGLLIFKIPSKK